MLMKMRRISYDGHEHFILMNPLNILRNHGANEFCSQVILLKRILVVFKIKYNVNNPKPINHWRWITKVFAQKNMLQQWMTILDYKRNFVLLLFETELFCIILGQSKF